MKRKAASPSKETAMNFMYQVKVLGHLDLENEWSGWKLRGPYLVSPQGDRVLPQRLVGIMLTEGLRKRGARAKTEAAMAPGPLPVVVAMPERRRRVA